LAQPSLIRSIERFFLGAFFFFLLLSLVVLINGIVADYNQSVREHFETQEKLVLRVQEKYQEHVSKIQDEIVQILSIRSEKDHKDFLKNYMPINMALLRKYLHPSEIKEMKEGRIHAPIMAYPLHAKKFAFERNKRALQWLFKPDRNFAVRGHQGVRPDSHPFLKKILERGIEFKADYETQEFKISKEDMQFLDLLDGKQDGRLDDPEFTRLVIAFVLIIENSDYALPKNTNSKHPWINDKLLTEHLYPLTWNCSFISLKANRLGIISHPYLAFTTKITEDVMDQRGKFYKATRVQFLLEWFPRDYLMDQTKKDEVLLLPSTFLIAKIDSHRLARSQLDVVIEEILKSDPEFRDYGIQVNFQGSGLKFFHKSNLANYDAQLSVFDRLRRDSFETYEPLRAGFEPFQANMVNEGSYQARSLDGTTSWFSRFQIEEFDDAMITIYESRAPTLNGLLVQWFFYIVFYLLFSILGYRSLNKQKTRLARAVHVCLELLFQENPSRLKQQNLPPEVTTLVDLMLQFQTMLKHNLDLMRLELGFQKILNVPRKTFKEYMADYYYFSADISQDYRWDRSYDRREANFSLLLPEELRDKQDLSRELHVVLRKPDDQEYARLLNRAMNKLIEKSRLELQDQKARKNQQEIELAQKLNTRLVPSIPGIQTQNLEGEFLYNRASSMGGFFHQWTLHNDKLLAFSGVVNGSVLASSLYAVSLMTYLDGLARTGSNWDLILEKLDEFSFKQEAKDLGPMLLIMQIDMNTGEISYSCRGVSTFYILRGAEQTVEKLGYDSTPLWPGLKIVSSSRSGQLNPGDSLVWACCEPMTQSNLVKLDLGKWKDILNQKWSLDMDPLEVAIRLGKENLAGIKSKILWKGDPQGA